MEAAGGTSFVDRKGILSRLQLLNQRTCASMHHLHNLDTSDEGLAKNLQIYKNTN